MVIVVDAISCTATRLIVFEVSSHDSSWCTGSTDKHIFVCFAMAATVVPVVEWVAVPVGARALVYTQALRLGCTFLFHSLSHCFTQIDR